MLLVIFGVGLVGAALLGASHRGTVRERPARRALAVGVALVGLTMQAYQLTPGDFDLDTSLPLQLCDLGTIAAAVALWTRDPRFAAFTYYVGLTLTVQAVFTPSLAEELPHPRYFGFWLLHFLVIWAAVYLTWGLRMRPSWRLYRTTVAATLCWVVAVFCLNLAAGTNYGYLNRKPSAGSLLDLLGPWPWYVALEVLIVAVVWAVVLTWPWTRAEDRAANRVLTP